MRGAGTINGVAVAWDVDGPLVVVRALGAPYMTGVIWSNPLVANNSCFSGTASRFITELHMIASAT